MSYNVIREATDIISAHSERIEKAFKADRARLFLARTLNDPGWSSATIHEIFLADGSQVWLASLTETDSVSQEIVCSDYRGQLHLCNWNELN